MASRFHSIALANPYCHICALPCYHLFAGSGRKCNEWVFNRRAIICRVPLRIFCTYQPLEDRLTAFKKLFLDKNLIHVGCVDHEDLLEKKISTNQWIHQHLIDISARCVGFDINESGIATLRDQYHIENIYSFNVCSGQHKSTLGSIWDSMFLGEVIEHVDNPTMFLSDIYENWKGAVKQLVLTTPNAFRIENERCARVGYEYINSDHRYWFTPFTISKILVKSGFCNPKVRFITSFPISKSHRWRPFLSRRRLIKHPALRDTLLVEAEF